MFSRPGAPKQQRRGHNDSIIIIIIHQIIIIKDFSFKTATMDSDI